MKLKWAPRILLFVLLCDVSYGKSLHEFVGQRVREVENASTTNVSVGPRVFDYVPFESMQYRYDKDLNTNDKDDSGTHSLRFKIKSAGEVFYAHQSREYSQKLLTLEMGLTQNLRSASFFQEIVEQVLIANRMNLIARRRAELQGVLDRRAQWLGLSKVDARGLVEDSMRLREVESGFGALRARSERWMDSRYKAKPEFFDELVKSVEPLATTLERRMKGWGSAKLEAAQAKLKLDQFDAEMKRTDSTRFVDFVELSHEPSTNDTKFGIAINIPFIRFDTTIEQRERVLLAAKEAEMRREVEEEAATSEARFFEIMGLAKEVAGTRDQLKKWRDISAKGAIRRDVEMQSALKHMTFKLEEDLAILTLKFYTAYIETLRDMGAFSKRPNVNFLDPNWREI